MTAIQTAKDYLNQIQKTDRLIQRLTDTVSTLRSRLISQNYELKPDRVQSSGSKDPIGETFAKIAELEAEINAHIDELVDWKKEAHARIGKIPDLDQQNILIARYIEGKRWEKISVEINFSIRQVHRIHGAALVAFAEENPDIRKDGTP